MAGALDQLREVMNDGPPIRADQPAATSSLDQLRGLMSPRTQAVTVGAHISTKQALEATPTEVDEGVFSILNTPSAALRYVVLKAIAPDKVGTFSQERQRTWKDFAMENIPIPEETFQIGPDAPADLFGRLQYLSETGQMGKFLSVFGNRAMKELIGDVADIALDPLVFAGKAGKLAKAVLPTKAVAAVAKPAAAVGGAVVKAVAKPAAAVGLTPERLAAATSAIGRVNEAGGEAVRKVLGIVSKQHELAPALRAHIMPQDAARIMGQDEASRFLKEVEFGAADVRRAATERISDRKIIDALESTDEAGELTSRLGRLNEPEKQLYVLYDEARSEVQRRAGAQGVARAMGKGGESELLDVTGSTSRRRALRQTEQGVAQAERQGGIFAVEEAVSNAKRLEATRRRVDEAVDALGLPEGPTKAGLIAALNDKVDDVVRAAERRGGTSGVISAEDAAKRAALVVEAGRKRAIKVGGLAGEKAIAGAQRQADKILAQAEAKPAGRALSAKEFKALEFPFLEGGAVERVARSGGRPARVAKAVKEPLSDVDKEVQALLRKHFSPPKDAGEVAEGATKAAADVVKAPKAPIRSTSGVLQAEDTARAARVYRKIGARLQDGRPLTEAARKVLDRYRPVLERSRDSVKRKMSAPAYVAHLVTKDAAVKVATAMVGSKRIGRTTVGPHRTVPGKVYEVERMLGKKLFNTDLDEIMHKGLAKGLEAVVNARTARDLIEDGLAKGYMALKPQEGWRTLKRDPYNIFVGRRGERAHMPDEVARFVENHWLAQNPGSLPWETFKKVNQWINHQFITNSPVSWVRDAVSDAVMMLTYTNNPLRAYRSGKRIQAGAVAAKGVERETFLEAVESSTIGVPLFATEKATRFKAGVTLLSKMPPILIPGTGAYWRHQTSEWARLGLFSELRAQGNTVAEAARKVKLALVDYDPRSFSAIENNLIKPLVPFYSFFRRNSQTQARMLMGLEGARAFQVSILPARLKRGMEGGQTRDERFEHESSMAIQVSRGRHWDPQNFFAQSDFFNTIERVAKGEIMDIGSERSGPIAVKKLYEVGANKNLFTRRALIPPERAADSFIGNIFMGGVGQDESFMGMDLDERLIHLLGVFRGASEMARWSRAKDDETFLDKAAAGLGWPRTLDASPEKVGASVDKAFKARLNRLKAQFKAVSADELEDAERTAAGKHLGDMKSAIYRGDTTAQREIVGKITALVAAHQERIRLRRARLGAVRKTG